LLRTAITSNIALSYISHSDIKALVTFVGEVSLIVDFFNNNQYDYYFAANLQMFTSVISFQMTTRPELNDLEAERIG